MVLNKVLTNAYEDIFLHIALNLTAEDLANTGRVSKDTGLPRDGRRESMTNEAAGYLLRRTATEYERSVIEHGNIHSAVTMLQELERFRVPLEFERVSGVTMEYTEYATRAGITTERNDDNWAVATTYSVMKRGKHYAVFRIKGDYYNQEYMGDVNVGVTRSLEGWRGKGIWPGGCFDPVHYGPPPRRIEPNQPTEGELELESMWSLIATRRTERWGSGNVHCCAYNYEEGDCVWSDWINDKVSANWEGMDRLNGEGEIGLLLDLDEGTLTVYMNGTRLGIMKDGLTGEYCWYTGIANGAAVHIEKKTPPS